jgi:hypothetical protein
MERWYAHPFSSRTFHPPFGQPSKSEYFTLKTEVLSEVTHKLMPDDILLMASHCETVPHLSII